MTRPSMRASGQTGALNHVTGIPQPIVVRVGLSGVSNQRAVVIAIRCSTTGALVVSRCAAAVPVIENAVIVVVKIAEVAGPVAVRVDTIVEWIESRQRTVVATIG